MKKYKLWIRKYNIFKNDYEVVEKVITTNDIYHEIGYIYCTTLEDIKRIDYHEIKEVGGEDEQKIQRRITRTKNKTNRANKWYIYNHSVLSINFNIVMGDFD